MTDLLKISLLGGVTLKLGGQPLTGLASRRTEALLIYLVCTGRSHTREALANLLWDNRSQSQALGNLRVLLTSLRQTLGPYVTITRQTVAFNQDSPHWLDVVELEAGLAAVWRQSAQGDPLASQAMAQLAQTLALYQGDFLQGFYLRDCRDFEGWQVTEQERLRLQTIEALHELVAGYLTAGDYPAGIEQARRLLQLDPLREGTHRSLMLLLAYSGQRNAALTQYETCCQILADELDVEPMVETTALYEQIKVGELRGEVENHVKAGPSRPVLPVDTTAPSSGAPAHNLPEPPTPLIGRQQEVATARDLLLHDYVRLVTLTGPGGTGKTRLGLQVATELFDQFAQGVCFVSLAEIAVADLVVSKIAQQLGLRDGGSQPFLDILKDYLQTKHLLLLLDNFEQVVDAAPVVADLLATAPGLKVLVTSRALLNLRGEHEFPVPPLKLPDPTGLSSLECLSHYEAIRLFIEQALVANSRFAITSENAPAVVEICQRLDGLPLAIELAAARIKLLPPQVMLARLSSRLKLLTGGAQDLPARQQTLRNTIDWSYNLLDEDEQILFARLAVFVGGFSLEAAEAICNVEGNLDVLGGVEALLNNSLLRQEEARNNQPRFRKLETIREYALERLEASGEAADIRRQHAHYFAEWIDEMGLNLLSPAESVSWGDLINEDYDNLRAVLTWSQATPEGLEMGPGLVFSLFQFWFQYGYMSEGRAWAERVLASSAAKEPGRARAMTLLSSGGLALWQGDLGPARTLIEESIAIWPRVEKGPGLALALFVNGLVLLNQVEETTTRSVIEECVNLSRELGYRWIQTMALISLGNVALGLGDFAEAKNWFVEALSVGQDMGDHRAIAGALNNLGEVARIQGDYAEADVYYKESEALFKKADEEPQLARLIYSLGYVARHQGDLERAVALFQKSLTMFRKIGNNRGIAECLAGLADLAANQGRSQWAARLFGAAEALLRASGSTWWPADRAEYERNLAAIRAALTEEMFAVVWAEGQAMTLEQAIAYASEQA